jgi:hypothetical protein
VNSLGQTVELFRGHRRQGHGCHAVSIDVAAAEVKVIDVARVARQIDLAGNSSAQLLIE